MFLTKRTFFSSFHLSINYRLKFGIQIIRTENDNHIIMARTAVVIVFNTINEIINNPLKDLGNVGWWQLVAYSTSLTIYECMQHNIRVLPVIHRVCYYTTFKYYFNNHDCEGRLKRFSGKSIILYYNRLHANTGGHVPSVMSVVIKQHLQLFIPRFYKYVRLYNLILLF